MITRLYTALAVCVCVTGCVYSNARPAPPPPARPPAPPPVTASGGGSSGHTQTNAPTATHGSQQAGSSAKDTTNEKRKVKQLEVAIQGKSHSPLAGRVELTDLPNGVRVVVWVDHMEPGTHGVVMHQFADCSAKDASSAGPRFDPDNRKQPELGHLGNLVAKTPNSEDRLEIVIPDANLTAGSPRSLLNRSIVIHTEDDQGTRRVGDDVGKRVGCAELTIAAAKARRDGRVVWRQ